MSSVKTIAITFTEEEIKEIFLNFILQTKQMYVLDVSQDRINCKYNFKNSIPVHIECIFNSLLQSLHPVKQVIEKNFLNFIIVPQVINQGFIKV